VKIDVEGFEDRVLTGFFKEAPHRCGRARVVIEHLSRNEWLAARNLSAIQSSQPFVARQMLDHHRARPQRWRRLFEEAVSTRSSTSTRSSAHRRGRPRRRQNTLQSQRRHLIALPESSPLTIWLAPRFVAVGLDHQFTVGRPGCRGHQRYLRGAGRDTVERQRAWVMGMRLDRDDFSAGADMTRQHHGVGATLRRHREHAADRGLRTQEVQFLELYSGLNKAPRSVRG